MIFSKRKKLAEEFYEWKKKKSTDIGSSLDDSPFNVITFLDLKGLLNDKLGVILGTEFTLMDKPANERAVICRPSHKT